MSPALLALVVVLALVLAFYTGFHDASSAVSTAITTRSLKESTALAMAAILNLLGALLGMLLLTVTADWALRLLGLGRLMEETSGAPDVLGAGLVAILLAVLAWEVLTWWIGMPSSTWHAFYGAALGASLAIGAAAAWDRLAAILVASIVGPVIAVLLAYLVMQGILALARNERLRVGHLRFAQTVSAGAVATGHGLSDSRLPLAVIVIACSVSDLSPGASLMVLVPVAIAMAAGTLLGGHRIIRTIGRRLTDLSTAQGLAAESSAVISMSVAIFGLSSPVSSSHGLASSVVGAGVAMGPRHVRWPVARTMVLVWLATPLATAVLGAALAGVLLELG
ncbi:inorganic phosphate transporter [Brachybacterium sp. FME24]|uniref:inorganic phosphate transporter n=1 Tax=Brachybacterium sp. FME24 TaxID=2742605 RepID=UPI001865C023|nr:inorganic phosphate transporter [Brachybacterium sp. FME24]